MNLLAIETSSPVLSVAVQVSGKAVVEECMEGFSRHAENLLPVLDRVLKIAGLGFEAVEAFLIGRGPGSFTGLRVGFATLKALVAGRPRPCFGALTLDMIAEAVPAADPGMLSVCLDAHRDRFYVRHYKNSKGFWRPSGSPKVLSPQAWLDEVPEGAFVTGNAMERYGDHFELASARKGIKPLPRELWHPRASSLIHLFQRQDCKASARTAVKALIKPAEFLPLYLRLSDPEERRRRHAAAC